MRYLKIGGAIGIALIAGVLYGKTLAPTATLVDSGELISACARLDIGHPPGFPLYVLVGRLFSHLPIGSVAVRLNFMSAVFAALAAGAVFLLSVLALQLKPSPPVARPKAAARSARKMKRSSAAPRAGPESPTATERPVWEILLPAAVAALTFAASNTLWSYATVTEVYTLNTFLVAVILWLVLRWAEVLESSAPPPPAAAWAWRLYLAAFIYGLAAGVHHVSIFFLAPGILYLLIRHYRSVLNPAVLLRSAAALALGFSVYLYLLIRARQKPPFNWGDPSTLERLIWHIKGKQYLDFLKSTPLDRALERFWFFCKLWASEFTWVGFALVVIGLVVLGRRRRRLFWFIVPILVLNTIWVSAYDIGEDNEAYGLPTFTLSAVLLAWGLRWVIEKARAWRPAWAPAVGLAFCALPALAVGLHYRPNDHSRYYVAYDYAHNVLDNVETDGVLLTMDWHLYSPLLYFQQIERLRPDVVVIDVNLLRRSWYIEYMRREYPWLTEAAAEDVKAYLAELDNFEHGRPYSPTIQDKYVAMINHFIRASLPTRPTYVMRDVQNEPEIAKRLFWVPQGPVFRLYWLKPESVAPGARRELNLRGMTDNSIMLDEVAQRIKRDYALMLVNRGIYLALYNHFEDALAWYQKALTLDSRSLDAYWKMAQSYKALGRTAEAAQAYQAALALDPDNRTLQAEYRSLSK